MRPLVFTALAAVVAVGLAGCGSAAGVPLDETIPVQGKVQLDGQPLAEGEITFSVDGKPPQIAPITDGAYSGQALVGENRVEIAVYKTETDAMTGDPMKINTLPARFNIQSTLKAPVTASGPSEFNFEVQSK